MLSSKIKSFHSTVNVDIKPSHPIFKHRWPTSSTFEIQQTLHPKNIIQSCRQHQAPRKLLAAAWLSRPLPVRSKVSLPVCREQRLLPPLSYDDRTLLSEWQLMHKTKLQSSRLWLPKPVKMPLDLQRYAELNILPCRHRRRRTEFLNCVLFQNATVNSNRTNLTGISMFFSFSTLSFLFFDKLIR